MVTTDPREVRKIMEEGRETMIGHPKNRHTFAPDHEIFYEEMALQAVAETLLKIVRLIAKDAGNKKLIWRVLPEVVETKGITDKLYMRYAFY